jgi:hypothetical protein
VIQAVAVYCAGVDTLAVISMALSSSQGSIRMMGVQALRYASSMTGYTAVADAGGTITLPNGKTLDIPEADIGFSMPAEFAEHSGCWIAWPRRPDVWRDGGRPARQAFTDVITAVARFEPVTVIAHSEQVSRQQRLGSKSSRTMCRLQALQQPSCLAKHAQVCKQQQNE